MNKVKSFSKCLLSIVIATSALLPISSISAAQTTTKAASASKSQAVTAATSSRAQELSQVLLDKYGVTGVQYAIMDHGKITLSGSAGTSSRADSSKITKNDMFGIGSTSKMYVTAATMMLADEKKIDIDRPLADYLPEFRMKDERYKQITPRMLMNHSSGLYGSHYGNTILFNDNDTTSRDHLLTSLRNEMLKADPGAFSVYSNDSFQLLELLVAKVSGKSYPQFIRERISKPLQLKSTLTPLDTFDRKRLVKTYFPTLTDKALPVENTNIIGTGGVYSTAEEVVKFAEVLTGQRPDLLSAASVQAMNQPEYRNGLWVSETSNIFNYGLGWDSVQLSPFDRYGLKAVSKGGDTLMYHATLVSLPKERLSMAVLTSGGSSMYNEAVASEVLLHVLKDKGTISRILPDQQFPAAGKIAMPAEMKKYNGTYGVVGETFNVHIQNGKFKLAAQMAGMIPAQQYIYAGKGKFRSEDGSTLASFERQKNGLTYLKLNAYLNIPELEQSQMALYIGQKLDKQPLSASVKKNWQQRNGKTYYNTDEKINSAFYLIPTEISKTIQVDTNQGYALGTKIKDANSSVNVMQIPVMSGRDTFDLNFYRQGKTEYLQINEQSFISEDAVSTLPAVSSSLTLPAGSYAKWMKLGKKTAGQKINVTLPAGAGFVVYDDKGQIVYSSVINGGHSMKLPEKGMIVFGGKAGDRFKISLSR
ncbi:serine hydrolase domain-containing protein [Paenibacillus sp. Z6-24]